MKYLHWNVLWHTGVLLEVRSSAFHQVFVSAFLVPLLFHMRRDVDEVLCWFISEEGRSQILILLHTWETNSPASIVLSPKKSLLSYWKTRKSEIWDTYLDISLCAAEWTQQRRHRRRSANTVAAAGALPAAAALTTAFAVAAPPSPPSRCHCRRRVASAAALLR